MLLAVAKEINVVEKITDHPWPGFQVDVLGMKMTLMSSGLAAMVLVALLLVVVILPLARRYKAVPAGGRNVLEIIFIFVRDMIGRPALHDKVYPWMPFLLTMFCFVLGMNLIGMMPLESITKAVGSLINVPYSLGGTPTSILTVTGGLALITLILILASSLRSVAIRFQKRKGWPLALCVILSPAIWIATLSPPIPGVAGVIIKLPMTFVEFVGIFARVAALMIRLFANMIAGHTLLAVFLMLTFKAIVAWAQSGGFPHWVYVGPLCVVASIGISILELLIAVIQAYVFTFLSAIFIGMAMEEHH
jgi:F-type H+-transporting ATPase subunit a